MAIVVINIIAAIFVLIGSINWGLVGIFDWNLVTAIFGAVTNAGAVIIYVLVFLSALWLLFATFYQRGKILFKRNDVTHSGKDKENY